MLVAPDLLSPEVRLSYGEVRLTYAEVRDCLRRGPGLCMSVLGAFSYRDTWRHRTFPQAGRRSGTIGPPDRAQGTSHWDTWRRQTCSLRRERVRAVGLLT